jgi:hypothetical protein
MRKTFVMRGQTASSGEEVLQFGKYKAGYAYKLTEFKVYPSILGTAAAECFAAITAGKTAADPVNPNFNDDGLIANAMFITSSNPAAAGFQQDNEIVNDTYVITQNLKLSCRDTDGANPINWQCTFESVKMTKAEEAAVNYKQFAISDE